MKLRVLNRKLHYWGAAVIALPVLIMIVTGLLLQLKKQISWIQPSEQRGVDNEPAISLAQVLEVCRNVSKAEVRSWADIHRVDVRPSQGILKVSAKNNFEIQIDTQTGKVLQVAYRRFDMIEAIHDGSWFHKWVKLGGFLPAALILLLLWMTGMYLFCLPMITRRHRSNEPRILSPPSGNQVLAVTEKSLWRQSQ